jgi:acetolactate synthase I/II/III large subunit
VRADTTGELKGRTMDGWPLSRRTILAGTAAVAAGLTAQPAQAGPLQRLRPKQPGWIVGRLTGAQAVAEALKEEAVACVYGIPGAQENELWDEFKSRGVPYLLVTHEYSAAVMADGYARATGRPGVCCVVPGPGVTNALTGLGEALLDSVPIVALVGDVGNGEKARPFQVHSLDNVALLKPVCKCVYAVTDVGQIPATIRQAFAMAVHGEPGPVAVVIPYNLLIELGEFKCPPPQELGVPFDSAAADRAVGLLTNGKLRVGIYAGLGCMDSCDALGQVAELLQAPVATSVSGKGCISENHALAVGWGYGPHASEVAEKAFSRDPLHPLKSGIDVLLAVGVKFSEVSTGYYGQPRPKYVIHVDANARNLGAILPADVCVHADAQLFLQHLLSKADALRRPADTHLTQRIAKLKNKHHQELCAVAQPKHGIDPLALVAALRKHLPCDAKLTDVTVSEHLAAESFAAPAPRTFFNPTDNQSMGWSIPAAIGAKRICDVPVATLTGDGCFLMSAMELSTAAREGIAVKFFILDDRTYHYMQMLQNAAYKRTTATELAAIDYCAFAKSVGVHYLEAGTHDQLPDVIRAALCHPGPVLVRILTDYNDRKIRWLEAVRDRYAKELSPSQKARFLARLGARSVQFRSAKND